MGYRGRALQCKIHQDPSSIEYLNLVDRPGIHHMVRAGDPTEHQPVMYSGGQAFLQSVPHVCRSTDCSQAGPATPWPWLEPVPPSWGTKSQCCEWSCLSNASTQATLTKQRQDDMARDLNKALAVCAPGRPRRLEVPVSCRAFQANRKGRS